MAMGLNSEKKPGLPIDPSPIAVEKRMTQHKAFEKVPTRPDTQNPMVKLRSRGH